MGSERTDKKPEQTEESMIQSISFDQHEIINNIKTLYCPAGFDADISFGKGMFYKNTTRPQFCFDIDPQCDFVEKASSTELPVVDGAFQSVVFDPPFLTYIRNGREHNSIMGKRFSGYWSYDELEKHYKDTIKECFRVISTRGILVFKCQDIIHNHKMFCTHYNVINWAEGMFRLEDIFILEAKNRMPVKASKGGVQIQRHARVFHSYFLVFRKLQSMS